MLRFIPFTLPLIFASLALIAFAIDARAETVVAAPVNDTHATRADTPRWLLHLDPPAEPATTPIPPLPVWKPLADTDALTFPLDASRLASPRFTGEILLTRADFARLDKALVTNPDLRASWEAGETMSRRLLADGNWSHWFPDAGKTDRYTYTVRGILPRLALLYAATGQPDLGRLVRLLTLDLVRRPLPFWTHAKLRAYEPKAPLGRLENAELARALALSWQWTPDLFTDAENIEIRGALVRKGLDPCLRWLEAPERRSNFMAVIGGGALATARVLEDKAAADKAAAVMEDWLGCIEDDGSYGEPLGYFDYASSAFFEGWWALGRKDGRARLQRHPAFKDTLRWMAFHYVIHRSPDATAGTTWQVNFGDDDFTTGASHMVTESLAYAFDDGLGTWLSTHLASPADSLRPLNIYEFLFRIGSLGAPLPLPVSPSDHSAIATTPLAPSRSFDVGPAILRSGWTFDHDIVLALRGAGGARTGYTHDRGNRNAFMLFVDGELFFAAPGRASYRSPLRKEWDTHISSHCGVSLDDKLQLREPVAHYTHFSDDGNLAQVTSEAAGAYEDTPLSISRSIWFDRANGVIAIEDIVLPSQPSVIGWHLLLANHDGRSRLTPPVAKGDGWRLSRPGGDVVFWIQADRPLAVSDKPGIMHTDYSYYPGDPGEGKPGSARQLTWTPAGDKPVDSLRVWTLILTRAQNNPDVRAVLDAPAPSQSAAPAWSLIRAGRTVHLRFTRGSTEAASLGTLPPKSQTP